MALNPQEWVGRTVGTYRLLIEIGMGRSGGVFVGEHTQSRERVAVKIIPRGSIADEVFAHRDELMRLVHPCIVRVRECGRIDGGTFIASEFVPFGRAAGDVPGAELFSKDLVDMVQDQTSLMPALQVVDYVCRLLDAFEYAHGSGARPLPYGGVHPRKILVAREEHGVRLRILDIGVPMARERRLASDPFLSPEETQGEVATVASDVYALGAIAYLLLTGVAPPSPLVPATVIRQDLSAQWDACIRRALCYEKEQRFAGYAELRCALLGLRKGSGLRFGFRTMRIAFFTNALVGAIVVAVIAAVIYYRMHKPAAGMPEPTPGIEVVDTSVPQIPDQEGSIVVVEKGQPPSGETFSPTGSGVQIGSATDILDTSSAVAIQDGGTGTDSAAVGESTQSVAVVVATNTTSLLDAVSAIEPGLHVVETGAETNVSATPDYVEYAVRSGDSLWGIARKHNMSFLALLTLNQIGSNVVLKVGQKLKVNRVDEALTAIGATGTSTVVRLPVGASVESRTTAGVEYRVKAKETYFSISRTFGCSVQALQTLNSNVMLKAGDTIRIPAKP